MADLIDRQALCEALLTRWHTADKNAEKQISEIMATIVTPIVAAQPTAQEPVWHDLRKNPDDLPPDDEDVIYCAIVHGYQCTTSGRILNSVLRHEYGIEAWCEYPRWDGASDANCKGCVHYRPCRDWMDMIEEEFGTASESAAIVCEYYETAKTAQERHGHWVDVEGNGYWQKCSECGNKTYRPVNFCSACGADMREDGAAE